MESKEYMKETIAQTADSAKDLAVFIGKITDNENACLKTLATASCSLKDISASMLAHIEALEKCENMEDTAEVETKLSQLMKKLRMGMEHMPEATKLSIDNDFASVMSIHADNVKGASLHRKMSTGSDKQHFEEYKQHLKEFILVLMYELYRMTCKD